MAKPKEFWISGGEVFYTEEDGRYMENALLKKTTHVIEKAALDEKQAEFVRMENAWRGEVDKWQKKESEANAKTEKLVEALEHLDSDHHIDMGTISYQHRQFIKKVLAEHRGESKGEE